MNINIPDRHNKARKYTIRDSYRTSSISPAERYNKCLNLGFEAWKNETGKSKCEDKFSDEVIAYCKTAHLEDHESLSDKRNEMKRKYQRIATYR